MFFQVNDQGGNHNSLPLSLVWLHRDHFLKSLQGLLRVPFQHPWKRSIPLKNFVIALSTKSSYVI